MKLTNWIGACDHCGVHDRLYVGVRSLGKGCYSYHFSCEDCLSRAETRIRLSTGELFLDRRDDAIIDLN